MRPIDLLLVGDAQDGPIEEPLLITTLEQGMQIFGGYSYERTALTSGSTGYTLSAAPWANVVSPLRYDSDGTLVPKTLFEFAVSGTTLTWNPPGDAAPDADPDTLTPAYSGTVVFQYRQRPGETSLLRGLAAALDTGVRVHALRLGGTAAEASLSGFTFRALHPGARYNGGTVLVSGGRVTVTPPPGTGLTRTYTPSSDVHLRQLLLDDLDRGYQPYYLDGTGSRGAMTVPSGTYTLAGGANGTLTTDLLMDFLEHYSLEGVDVLCPIGLDTLALSGSGILDELGDPHYPTLVVAQAPASGAALSGHVNTRRNLVSVGFQVYYDAGNAYQRLEAAAPMVAAIISRQRFGLTLSPLPHAPIEPTPTQTQLHSGAAHGHTLAYESISKGPALWHVVTGDPEWPVSTFRSLQEVARLLYLALEPLLGTVALTLDDLENEIDQAFLQLSAGRVLDWTLERVQDTLYVDLILQPHGEVRTIQARLAIGNTSPLDA